MDTAIITWPMPGGLPGTDDQPRNPLSRAVNQLLEDGKPFKQLRLCFCDGPGKTEGDPAVRRWLGCFVLSAADRVIFFPGYAKDPTGLKTYHGRQLRHDQPFATDHITLEKDFKKWHVTTPKSTDHKRGPRTIDVGEGRYSWFGMSIADFSVLRRVWASTVVKTHVPESDSTRRLQAFVKSREGADFPVVSFHPDLQLPQSSGIPHFAAVVGPKGFPDYTGDKLSFPDGSPFLSKPLPLGHVHLPTRIHRLSLSETIDIQIVTSWLPASLSVPVTFTAGG